MKLSSREGKRLSKHSERTAICVEYVAWAVPAAQTAWSGGLEGGLK